MVLAGSSALRHGGSPGAMAASGLAWASCPPSSAGGATRLRDAQEIRRGLAGIATRKLELPWRQRYPFLRRGSPAMGFLYFIDFGHGGGLRFYEALVRVMKNFFLPYVSVNSSKIMSNLDFPQYPFVGLNRLALLSIAESMRQYLEIRYTNCKCTHCTSPHFVSDTNIV